MKTLTYMKLMNRFWDLHKVKPITQIDTELYFLLLNESHLRKRLNPIELQTRYIISNLDLTGKTLAESCNRLKEWGLIDVAPVKNAGSMIFMIVDAKITDNDLYDSNFCQTSTDITATQPLLSPEAEPTSDIAPDRVADSKPKAEPAATVAADAVVVDKTQAKRRHTSGTVNNRLPKKHHQERHIPRKMKKRLMATANSHNPISPKQ